MSASDASQNGQQDLTNPTFTERVRSLAGRRRSSRFLQSSGSDHNVSDAPVEVESSVGRSSGRQSQAFAERCLREVDITQPVGRRAAALREVAQNHVYLSVEQQISILSAAHDIPTLSGLSEARQAWHDLINILSSGPALEASMREHLLRLIVSEETSMTTREQITILRRLTVGSSLTQPLTLDVCSVLAKLLQEQYDIASRARSRSAKGNVKRCNDRLGEEEDLRMVMSLIRDLIEANATTLRTSELSILLDRIYGIALKTTSQYDLDGIMSVIAVTTRFSQTPRYLLHPCIEILCGVSGMRHPEEYPDLDNSFRCLLASPDRQYIIDKILHLIVSAPMNRQTTVTRGAALTLKGCISDQMLDTDLQVGRVIEALLRLAQMGRKYQLLGIEAMFACISWPGMSEKLFRADWAPIYDVLQACTVSGTAFRRWKQLNYTLPAQSPLATFMSSSCDLHNVNEETFLLPTGAVARWLMSSWSMLDTQQRAIGLHGLFVMATYVSPDLYLPITIIMGQHGLIDSATADGLSNLSILVALVLLDPAKPEEPRLQVLDLLHQATFSVSMVEPERDRFESMISLVLSALHGELNIRVTASLAKMATGFIVNNRTLAEPGLRFLSHLAQRKIAEDPNQATSAVSELALRYLSQNFQSCLQYSSPRAEEILKLLVLIASTTTTTLCARLIAMATLVRLRQDSEGAFTIVESPDILGITDTVVRPDQVATSIGYPNIHGDHMTSDSPSPANRPGRSSGIHAVERTRSRSTTRSGDNKGQISKRVQPIWMDMSLFSPESETLIVTDQRVQANGYSPMSNLLALDITGWLDAILTILAQGADWSIYSFVVVHLPSQLLNKALFTNHRTFIADLHNLISSQLASSQFPEPPPNAGTKKGDIALCLYQTLTVLLGYRHFLSRVKLEESVRLFHMGMAKWDRATKCCIHALAVYFHELPDCLERHLSSIVTKMSQIITQSHLAIDILEFLVGLARCPKAYENVTRSSQEFVRTIFGMCIQYIHHAREQARANNTGIGRQSFPRQRRSDVSTDQKHYSTHGTLVDAQSELPEYVSTLAYHVITAWFLNMDIRQRPQHVGWIAKNLAWKDAEGNEMLAEQSQVTLDMMHRTAYLDLGETQANNQFHDQHDRIIKRSWLVGMSVITIETAAHSGLTQVTKRQASGTTHSMYQPYIAPLPAHHVPRHSSQRGSSEDENPQMYPDHVLLQLLSTIAPMPIPLQPIVLPDDDTMSRALRTFDMNDTVDGYKTGVIYVGRGQTREVEILCNTSGSTMFGDFLEALGTKVPLRNAPFKAQGLDQQSDRDGTHTYAWRDRVIEIVFHVPTMMPTDTEEDPQCIHKKKHIGNNFVNIIYNDSGVAYEIDTLSSQLNFINIVITPNLLALSRQKVDDLTAHTDDKSNQTDRPEFFTVHTVCSPSFPQISPAATPKIISSESLASFVRQLTITASLFCQIWCAREGGESISSWRNRLKDIARLRERYSNTQTSGNVSYPEMGTVHDRGGAKSYTEGDDWNGTLAMGGMAEKGHFLMSLDFTRWT